MPAGSHSLPVLRARSRDQPEFQGEVEDDSTSEDEDAPEQEAPYQHTPHRSEQAEAEVWAPRGWLRYTVCVTRQVSRLQAGMLLLMPQSSRSAAALHMGHAVKTQLSTCQPWPHHVSSPSPHMRPRIPGF